MGKQACEKMTGKEEELAASKGLLTVGQEAGSYSNTTLKSSE